jgi:hypothetical protein
MRLLHIVTEPQLTLYLENIDVEDGVVYIFGAGDS